MGTLRNYASRTFRFRFERVTARLTSWPYNILTVANQKPQKLPHFKLDFGIRSRWVSFLFVTILLIPFYQLLLHVSRHSRTFFHISSSAFFPYSLGKENISFSHASRSLCLKRGFLDVTRIFQRPCEKKYHYKAANRIESLSCQTKNLTLLLTSLILYAWPSIKELFTFSIRQVEKLTQRWGGEAFLWCQRPWPKILARQP